jgi:hypothetical protein
MNIPEVEGCRDVEEVWVGAVMFGEEDIIMDRRPIITSDIPLRMIVTIITVLLRLIAVRHRTTVVRQRTSGSSIITNARVRHPRHSNTITTIALHLRHTEDPKGGGTLIMR